MAPVHDGNTQILPAFYYDYDKRQFTAGNLGPLAAFASCGIMIGWGVVITVIVSPAFPGLIGINVGLLTGTMLALHLPWSTASAMADAMSGLWQMKRLKTILATARAVSVSLLRLPCICSATHTPNVLTCCRACIRAPTATHQPTSRCC